MMVDNRELGYLKKEEVFKGGLGFANFIVGHQQADVIWRVVVGDGYIVNGKSCKCLPFGIFELPKLQRVKLRGVGRAKDFEIDTILEGKQGELR